MKGMTIDQLSIGTTGSFTKTVTETDVYLFAGISGDLNPAHINEEYAKDTAFKGRIAHGILGVSFISTVLGMYMPGPGTIYMKQEVKFLAPVRIGDTITAKAEVIDMNREKNRVTLKTTCTNQNGVVVIDGEALVSPPKA